MLSHRAFDLHLTLEGGPEPPFPIFLYFRCLFNNLSPDTLNPSVFQNGNAHLRFPQAFHLPAPGPPLLQGFPLVWPCPWPWPSLATEIQTQIDFSQLPLPSPRPTTDLPALSAVTPAFDGGFYSPLLLQCFHNWTCHIFSATEVPACFCYFNASQFNLT